MFACLCCDLTTWSDVDADVDVEVECDELMSNTEKIVVLL